MWAKLLGISFLQAAGAGVVLGLWTQFMTNLSKFVDTTAKPDMPGFVLIPIMFVIAATLSAGAVLGYPVYLAFQKRWKTVIVLVGLTLIWLGIFAAILISIH